MIVQTTMTKNECFLLKEMLPIWTKYADGFVFYDDGSEDDTLEFLTANKEKYNILHIFSKNTRHNVEEELWMETDNRQIIFDKAYEYTGNITCLDSDEYFDGRWTKDQLELFLEQNKNNLYYLHWAQYTGKNELRVDTMWRSNFTDRIGSYSEKTQHKKTQMHSLHLPNPGNINSIDPNNLFIAHLQWMDKRAVGVKQYYWKVLNYVDHKLHGVEVCGKEAYDNSVNNFAWEYSYFPYDLKVRLDVFSSQDMKQNLKLKTIVEYTNKYDVPNLGDWNMGIYDYAKKQNLR